MNFWRIFVGRFRGWLGSCPKCNLDPKTRAVCNICGGNWKRSPVPDHVAEKWVQLYEAEMGLGGMR